MRIENTQKLKNRKYTERSKEGEYNPVSVKIIPYRKMLKASYRLHWQKAFLSIQV